jgi:predicted dehydrogenase
MSKVRWGVIGAGGIADRRTIPEGIVPSANAVLAAVMDTSDERARAVGAKYGVPFSTVEDDLLAMKDVEAVYIATPACAHRAQLEKALKAGKHVLIEKPLAHNLKDAKAIVAAAARRKTYVAEGYMMKFHPLHQALKDLVASGKLGTIVSARAQLSCWYPNIPGAWRQDPKQSGGGSLIDMATHCYDLLEWILGPVTEVCAMTGTLVQNYPVEDASTTLLRFRNGAQASVDAFFSVRDEGCLRRLEIYGSNGSALCDGTIGQGGGSMKVCLLGGGAGYDADQARNEVAGFVDVPAGEYNMYRAEIEAFSQGILEKRRPAVNGLKSGLRIMKIADAAYRSAKSGKREKVGG